MSAINGDNLSRKGKRHAEYGSIYNELNRMTIRVRTVKLANIIEIKNRNVYFKFAKTCFTCKFTMLQIPGKNNKQIKIKNTLYRESTMKHELDWSLPLTRLREKSFPVK